MRLPIRCARRRDLSQAGQRVHAQDLVRLLGQHSGLARAALEEWQAALRTHHLQEDPEAAPSPAPGASPGESLVPALAVRTDQRIIDLYQWWLLHHREIEAASEGVVPLPTP